MISLPGINRWCIKFFFYRLINCQLYKTSGGGMVLFFVINEADNVLTSVRMTHEKKRVR